jgi:uncharacterized protein
MNRRLFVAGGFAGAVASALPQASGPATRAAVLNQQPGMKYRPLGNAGISLSVISNGGLVAVESVIAYAIDKGVNLVHVAEPYVNGRSIVTVGNVLKTKRDKVYIAIKDDFRDLDVCLKALNTDHVDFIMFNRHTPGEVNDQRMREAFEKYKAAGKVRWAGLTCHGAVKETTAAAIQAGWFSLVQPSLNQPALESMQEELRLAQQKGIGIMPMKTMRGINGLDMQAVFLKKVLAVPSVVSVVKGLESFEMFDAFLKASNEPLTAWEDKSLYRYAQVNRARNCMACGDCQSACPDGVETPAILRAKDYYHAQCGDFQLASETYNSLRATGSARCADCSACEQACPNGINIREHLAEAQRLFAV